MGPSGTNSIYTTNYSTGYITEKMYVLLRLYLQNKNWNPSLELLQCFSELKETSMLPSASYLQMLLTKISLNNQGRLILRENGKLIIPYEQFTNAIMMKHLNGPYGKHLSLENTITAITDNFTIGKEFFGMEKEFITDIIKNCPDPSCQYYKTQIELSQNIALTEFTYSQESEIGLNSSYNSDFKMAFNIPITSHTEASLPELSETKNSNNQDLPLLKKITSNFLDSSLIILPSIESCRSTEFLRLNNENYENQINLQNIETSEKELSVHSEIWSIDTERKKINSNTLNNGQDKVVRIFAEIMKNMSRIKTCVRPAMCKPYGKQSETLQKSKMLTALLDTIQLIQSLRNFLPIPHTPISSWKNEEQLELNCTNLSIL